MVRPIAITLAVFVVGTVAFANAQDTDREKCVTSTGLDGFCVNIYQCEPLLRMIQQIPLDQTDIDYLRSTQCGLQGRTPKVCCVPEESAVGPVGFA